MKKNYLLLMFLFIAGIIQAQVTPTFTQVAPICSGATLAALPTTSNNAIIGTWSPAVVNTATTNYTFTPDAGQNATTATMTIIVNALPVLTFTANPFPICEGSSSILTANANNLTPTLVYGSQTIGMLPAAFGVPNTAALSATLANSPNNGCLVPTIGGVSPYTAGQFAGKIVLIPRGVCSFTDKVLNAQNAGAIGVIIYNTAAGAGSAGPGSVFSPGGALATINIPVYGISNANGLAIVAAMTANEVPITLNLAPELTYLWGNGATTKSINSGVLNVSTTFNVIVTVTATGCSTTSNVNAAVTPNIVPTFVQIAPFCAGTTAPVLPTVSTNTVPLNGTWLPAVVDNTSTGIYEFTPTPVAGQCLAKTTMVITVTPNTTDVLTVPACGASYTWAANNVTYNAGGTYTFQDGCVARTLNLTLTPASDVVTTVTECATYTWANNNQTYTTSGTYTGTTTNCVTQKLNLTITPLTVPAFTQVAPICSGDVLTALPTTSTNGVAGTWAPAIDPLLTTTYTFTPTSTVCTSNATMTITVNVKPVVTVTNFPAVVCAGTSTTVTANATNFAPSINYVDIAGPVTAPANQAQFGAVLSAPLSGTLVNSPNNGCSVAGVSPYTAGQFAGKIVLIQRGICPFTQKAKNAQDAGAIAVVIYNNVATLAISPAGSDPSITIPVIAVTLEAGNAIIANLTNNEIPFTIATPALTYLWSTGATTRTITTPVLNAATTYTVTVTNPNGGCSVIDAPITIAITDLPVVSGAAIQTLGTASTLANIVVNPTTVVWFANQADALAGTAPLLNTQVVTNATTYYAVSTAGTCRSTPYAVTVNTTVSSIDFDANTTLRVSPNPFTNLVNVSIDSKATIEIFDVVGKSIQNLAIQNGLTQIDLGNLASGVYMMKVVNEINQSKTVRIVKN